MRSFASFIIALVLIAIMFFLMMSRAPDMLASHLSQKIGTTISIDSVNFRPSTIQVRGFEVSNAHGYTLPKAFSAKTITLQAPLTTYFKDRVIVEEILVDNIYLGIEFDSINGTTGNWTNLLSHYQKTARLNEQDNKKVLIKKLIFTNIQSDLVFHSEGGKITKLPQIDRIELTNVGTEGGFPIDQLTSSILGQMLKEAFLRYHLNNMLNGLLFDSPSKALDNLIKPFKGIFNMAPKEDLELKHTV